MEDGQTFSLPLMLHTGREFTVTVAVPETGPVPLASLTETNEYVVVVVGVTINVYGDTRMLFIVTGLLPSV